MKMGGCGAVMKVGWGVLKSPCPCVHLSVSLFLWLLRFRSLVFLWLINRFWPAEPVPTKLILLGFQCNNWQMFSGGFEDKVLLQIWSHFIQPSHFKKKKMLGWLLKCLLRGKCIYWFVSWKEFLVRTLAHKQLHNEDEWVDAEHNDQDKNIDRLSFHSWCHNIQLWGWGSEGGCNNLSVGC